MKTQTTNLIGNRYFLYARKSTDSEERQVRSIDDQITELHELAEKENLIIVKTFIEKRTAKTPGRPVFAEMITRLEAGEADGILAWHPDRLARNSIDGGRVVYLLDTGTLKALKFSTFWFDNTPQGKFMLQIAFGQSKYYVDNLSENIKRGIRQKLKNGLWPQMAPLGYLNDKPTKTIVVDHPKAALVKKAFELYATGTYSYALLAKTMAELGLTGRKKKKQKLLNQSNFQYLLQNPFYYGLIRYGGGLYEGKHEAIISKSLFDRVQEQMKHKCKPNKRKPAYFVFRGLMHCGECGCLITAEKQKGHTYYRCTKRRGTCTQRYVREESLTAQMTDYIRKNTLSEKSVFWMVDELEKEQAADSNTKSAKAEQLRQEIRGIDEKGDRLMAAYLEQVISLPEYQMQKNRLVEAKQIVKEKLDALPPTGSPWFEPAIGFIKANNTGRKTANSGNLEQIKDFLQIIGSNYFLTAQQVRVKLREDWELVAHQQDFEPAPVGVADASTQKSVRLPTNANWRTG